MGSVAPSQVGIEQISAAKTPPAEAPDSKTLEEQGELDSAAHAEELASAKQDRGERKLYAARIFYLMCVWLALLFAVLALEGWEAGGFHLEQGVLLALIGGTTANVLGIFVLVARYLFWKPKA